MAIPTGQDRTRLTSSTLFSIEIDSTLVRTLAERVAFWTNQTSLLILGIGETLNRERILELTTVLKDHFVS
jgi:hypothetical protein